MMSSGYMSTGRSRVHVQVPELRGRVLGRPRGPSCALGRRRLIMRWRRWRRQNSTTRHLGTGLLQSSSRSGSATPSALDPGHRDTGLLHRLEHGGGGGPADEVHPAGARPAHRHAASALRQVHGSRDHLHSATLLQLLMLQDVQDRKRAAGLLAPGPALQYLARDFAFYSTSRALRSTQSFSISLSLSFFLLRGFTHSRVCVAHLYRRRLSCCYFAGDTPH